MKELGPYLNFNGNCEDAFKFYEECLHGTIESMFRHEGTPMAQHVSPEWQSKIMHARLKLGDYVIMGSDSPPEHYKPNQGMYVFLSVETAAEADRIYQALSPGATVVMPIDKTFWAERFGMLVDRFGTPWMINCELSA